jgi:hypothetical protein
MSQAGLVEPRWSNPAHCLSPHHLPKLRLPVPSGSALSRMDWLLAVFLLPRTAQKIEIISLLCWQLRKWQFFLFPIQKFLPIG